jgi:hypothetical protein
MFKVPERLYRTTGDRFVAHGDPEAAFLAFPAGAELSDEEARRLGVAEYFAEKARATPPQNKMGARPSDKSKSNQKEGL